MDSIKLRSKSKKFRVLIKQLDNILADVSIDKYTKTNMSDRYVYDSKACTIVSKIKELELKGNQFGSSISMGTDFANILVLSEIKDKLEEELT